MLYVLSKLASNSAQSAQADTTAMDARCSVCHKALPESAFSKRQSKKFRNSAGKKKSFDLTCNHCKVVREDKQPAMSLPTSSSAIIVNRSRDGDADVVANCPKASANALVCVAIIYARCLRKRCGLNWLDVVCALAQRACVVGIYEDFARSNRHQVPWIINLERVRTCPETVWPAALLTALLHQIKFVLIYRFACQ